MNCSITLTCLDIMRSNSRALSSHYIDIEGGLSLFNTMLITVFCFTLIIIVIIIIIIIIIVSITKLSIVIGSPGAYL